MAYEVEFAGNKLHNYFKVLKIKRTLLPPRTNHTKEIPSLNGLLYTGYRYEPKVYTLECALVSEGNLDFADKIKEIAFILDVKEPSKLIFGDTPWGYNYAVIDGTIDIERVKYTGQFSIDFICYDPIMYSIEPEEFYGDSRNRITVGNFGNTDAYPVTSIAFSKDAFFLQCTNYTGETILIGTPPSVNKPQGTFNPQILKDVCETMEGWNPVSNVVDAGREVTGSLMINAGGYGITMGSVSGGTSNKWYGGASRKNLSKNLKDFKVEVKVEFNSTGVLKGGGSTPPTGNGKKYKVTANPSLRVRDGRGTNFKQIGSLKQGTEVTITNIDKGWGYVGKYSDKDGYVSMDYVKEIATSSGGSEDGAYKVTPKEGLNVRDGRGTNFKKLTAIPSGTQVNITDVASGWGKCTYNSKTGYASMQYLSKVSSKSMYTEEDTEPSAENKLGTLEIYGYDANGTKLFKFCMEDSQKWYEYSEPLVEFGSKLVLDDGSKCPAPKTIKEKVDEEKTTEKPTDSGKHGDWNDMVGWFTLERKTVNDAQKWVAKVEKISNEGTVVRTLQTQTLSGNYPKGELNNIVIYIGQYNGDPSVDVMNVNEVYVTDLSNPPKPEEIVPIFKKDDELIIDNLNQKIYKNGRLYMKHLDIGSQFFSSPVGSSQYTCKSDDEDLDIISSVQMRWL